MSHRGSHVDKAVAELIMLFLAWLMPGGKKHHRRRR